MGFLGKIFKRKEGGTFLGNMIRGVAKTYTGGILGSGAQMKQPKGEAIQEAIAQSPLPQQQPSPLAGNVNNFLKQSLDGVSVQGGIDPNTKWYIGGAVGAIILAIVLTKK